MRVKICVFLWAVQVLPFILTDESQFSINHNKAIQLVNERFISFSVDPTVFFSRLPQRDILLKLIAHLPPAYLSVAGQSTQFLDFNVDARRATKVMSDAATSLTFSPAMWWSLNEWIQKTNFTPIFGINDASAGANGRWEANDLLPFLDMTAKMNVNAFWQLGFDCSRKGFERYKDDLKALRHALDAFPAKKDKWQIVGSDLSRCTPSDHSEILRMYLADLDHADAVMWEEDESIVSNFLSNGVMENLLAFHPAPMPIWLSTPKSQHPIGFEDGIKWAVEIGEAARKGFAVIFREPRMQEYYSTTPAYWVTVLHKALMGRNVLDVKLTAFANSETRVYAHCARDQNSFSVRGALTVMIVNNSSQLHQAAFRLPTHLKSIEVRSYILTSMENTTDTYLNNEKLTLETFKLRPKLRRAKVLTHLLLTAPAKSIAFFVLPGAKLPICIDSEDDTALILKEIERIQAVDFAEPSKSADGLMSRLSVPRASVSLADLHRKLQEEFKTDATLVPKLGLKSHAPTSDNWRQQLMTVKIAQKSNASDPALQGMKSLNFLFDKVKSDAKTANMDLKNFLRKDERKNDILGSALPKMQTLPSPSKPRPVNLDLNLSSGEVFRILGDRARSKLEKKIGFTDFEFDLDDMLERALKGKFRRDINMRLLDEKVHEQEAKEHKFAGPSLIKKKKKKQEKVEATDDSADIEGLPDMSKIIPTFGKPTKAKSVLEESSLFGNKALPKLDLFGGGEKVDLQTLLSLLGSKAATEWSAMSSTSTVTPLPTATTTEEPAFLRSPDFYDSNHDFDRYLNELEDELSGGSFFDHFGDSIHIQPKIWDGEESVDFPNAFLNNEFIVNDDNIAGAIQKPEQYFHQDPNTRTGEEFEPIFDSFEEFARFKRELHDFIHRLKGSKSVSNSVQKHRAAGLRRPRSAEENVADAPAAPNNIIKAYESKLDWKEWRPEDMLQLPKLHDKYKVGARIDQISFNQIPRSRGTLGPANAERINIRKARRVATEIDSMENAIDSFLNTIEKDTKFIKPLLTAEEGEYTIVLPTHDKLALLRQKDGGTEIVLHHDAAGSKDEEAASDRVDDSTCAATDLYPSAHLETLKNAFVAGVGTDAKDQLEKRVDRSEYVQKIPPPKPRQPAGADAAKAEHPQEKHKYNLAFVADIVNSFSRFMKKLHNKVDSFFRAVE